MNMEIQFKDFNIQAESIKVKTKIGTVEIQEKGGELEVMVQTNNIVITPITPNTILIDSLYIDSSDE